MADFSPLHSALYESTPENIADALRYLRKADAVMAALMPMSANTQAQQPAAAVPGVEFLHDVLRRSGWLTFSQARECAELVAEALAERAQGVGNE